MRSRVVPFAIGIVLSSGLALAQAPAEKAKPGPEHKRLGSFVGKWTADAEIKPNAFMPGGKATSQDTCEWFDGGLAVICRPSGKSPIGPTESIDILGSPMVMASVPRGTVQGGTWVYDDETKMGGKSVKSRYTIKETSPTSYTLQMGDDGRRRRLADRHGREIHQDVLEGASRITIGGQS